MRQHVFGYGILSVKEASFLEKIGHPKKTKNLFFLDTCFWMVKECITVKILSKKTKISLFWIDNHKQRGVQRKMRFAFCIRASYISPNTEDRSKKYRIK